MQQDLFSGYNIEFYYNKSDTLAIISCFNKISIDIHEEKPQVFVLKQAITDIRIGGLLGGVLGTTHILFYVIDTSY